MVQLRQKTKAQEARENRDRAIYEEYERLLQDPRQSRLEAQLYLARKYRFARRCTAYEIWKREAERRRREQQQNADTETAVS